MGHGIFGRLAPRRSVGALLMAFLALSTTDTAFAAKKPPKARVQLQKALRQLLKTKNYTVDTKVLGGLAKSAEHNVVEVTVNESYGGAVFGSSRNPIMHIPSIKAYKQPKAGHGVIDRDGLWARILATQEGVKMDRLIDFPTLILAEAVKYSKTARWLDDNEIAKSMRGTSRSTPSLDEDTDTVKREDHVGAPTSKTSVKKKSKSKKKKKKKKGKTSLRGAEPETPRVLRVTAAPRQALDIWIKRVENSGCMREG